MRMKSGLQSLMITNTTVKANRNALFRDISMILPLWTTLINRLLYGIENERWRVYTLMPARLERDGRQSCPSMVIPSISTCLLQRNLHTPVCQAQNYEIDRPLVSQLSFVFILFMHRFLLNVTFLEQCCLTISGRPTG